MRMAEDNDIEQGHYFLFNVEKGMEKVKLDAFKGKANQ
jgi:hypothetical protein